MDPVFTGQGYVESLYRNYADELSSEYTMGLKWADDGAHDGGISRVDGELVYMLLRDLNARNVIEFSPNQGYSTAFLAQALVANGSDKLLATFDLELYPKIFPRMQGLDLAAFFHKGDALEKIPRYLAGGRSRPTYRFLSYRQRSHQRICPEILPILGENCVYFIHDLCYRPLDVTCISHYVAINPFEIGGTAMALGEAACLSEHFIAHATRYSLFSTNRCFGDQHECSTRLARNKELIDKLTRAVAGFSLPPSAGVAGGIPRPPMGLLVVPRSRFGME